MMDQSLPGGCGHVSVLSCFPPSVGRDVAVAVVKPLGVCLGNPDTQSLLQTDRQVCQHCSCCGQNNRNTCLLLTFWFLRLSVCSQVKWTMEVLCYGLTLPLDGDTVKLCVDVYTDWLMALVYQRDSIPPPISREPNLYIQKILQHLDSLFMPRSDRLSPVYLSLCQQVLCAVQSLARESHVMNRDTWETLLHFLLRINHAMLVSPTSTGGVSEQLSVLSVVVLFEVWLLSCSRCFPSRSLWLKARQMLSSWRREPVVTEQWSRVIAALTSRLLSVTFGPAFPHFKVPAEDAVLIPADLDDQRVSHTWFRFLHLLSNPVDLSRQSPSTWDEASKADNQLPNIFFRAMRAISTLVDAFLGVTVIDKKPTEQLMTHTGLTTRTHFRDRLPSLGVAVTRSPFKDRLPSYGLSRPRSGSAPPTPGNIGLLSVPSAPPSTNSPPPHNRRLKPANVTKATSKAPVMSSPPRPPPSSPPRPSASPLRCKVDSLLHLFGYWLFDAALPPRCDVTVMSDRWAAGRAEACGTLCRMFTCKKTAEDILPAYLSRFYLVLLQVLQVLEETRPPVLASILLNSTCLFSCDLRGVNLLLPTFTSAVENVLLDRDLLRFKSFVSVVDLRRASILILLSLLPLPLQFPSIQSEVFLDRKSSGDDVTAGNFLSLKPRLISVLIGALHTESDATNTQIILGVMLNLVQDLALLEAAGQIQQDTESRCGPSRPRRTRGTSGTNTASTLWVQFVRLLTQRLTAQWRNDSAVCLCALEILGGLAKVQVSVDVAERRRAMSSVCTYIVFQCNRPPPLHSRDLHSIIVAAFYCLNVWVTQHVDLLHQQECLLEVLEIVELGISGRKSREEQEVRCKDVKELNPASLRVKEAAEATLSCVMQVSGAFPVPLQDEDSLVGSLGVKKFRYFVVDSSVIMAILEQPLGPEEASCPSLAILIRGASGRHTWTLQLHLQPREGRAHTQEVLIPEHHGVDQKDIRTRCVIRNQLFPENLDRVPPVKADLSIPALQETLPEQMQQQVERLHAVFKRQQQVESQPLISRQSVVMTNCRPPPPVTTFQTARLFLSHLGLLTPETLKDPGTSSVPAQLVSLDSSLPGFSEDMRRLDELSSRYCYSALVFYVRAGQRTAAEILRNVESNRSVSSHFLDFISSLGHPVEVGRQPVGGVRTSLEFSAVLGDSGGGVFNGERFVLMYTDALTEITFIVPSSSSHSQYIHIWTSVITGSVVGPVPFSYFTADWLKSPDEAEPLTEPPSNLKSDTELSRDPQPTNSPVDFVSSFVSSESKLLIIWVECFEDVESKTPRPPSASNLQLIFIHPLKTGLYRVHFHGNANSKFGLVVPLVNGSVVSKRSLGILIRETVINCCHRRRLETDSAPPPHVKRKHMISDIIHRYRSLHSGPTFYSALFQDP
ncbi:ral GTPase-activating protein subunit beta-like isoform X2 [Larimichthys crocea]|uniref:ral GTPase-activating protein subunit beta-like isoform X2 n=1 Tax=Larimichthys crocea TaxID=215358 RepID=UPI000F5FDE3C|nr:ral GTPase-activating protein subunit beta-like isoform X2 [Larimichthys crocea]